MLSIIGLEVGGGRVDAETHSTVPSVTAQSKTVYQLRLNVCTWLLVMAGCDIWYTKDGFSDSDSTTCTNFDKRSRRGGIA